MIRCSIQVFENHQPSPATVFRQCAEKYLVSGKSLSEMCDHNAAVAWNLGRHQTATTWSMVKLLFAYSGSDVSAAVGAAVTASRSVMTAVQREDSDSVPTDSRPGTRHQSGNSYPMTNNTDSTNSLVGTNSTAQSNDRGDTSGGVSEEAESEVEDIDSQVTECGFHFGAAALKFTLIGSRRGRCRTLLVDSTSTRQISCSVIPRRMYSTTTMWRARLRLASMASVTTWSPTKMIGSFPTKRSSRDTKSKTGHHHRNTSRASGASLITSWVIISSKCPWNICSIRHFVLQKRKRFKWRIRHRPCCAFLERMERVRGTARRMLWI